MLPTVGNLQELLIQGHRIGASDLILVVGKPPCVYIKDKLIALDKPMLRSTDLEQWLIPLLQNEQIARLRQQQDLDFSFGISPIGRCRINVHYQRGSLAAAFRYIPETIPLIEDLNLPDILHQLAQLPYGLVLVTGAAGQGKSTTLAAMIEHINHTCAKHVITLEDPIEYIFTHDKSLIEQREIGQDSPSFASALRHVLRQKPDVILVGEMRDPETIATTITAAETGHLVLATLHTQSAPQAIQRIVDAFEGPQQQQIRIQLAYTLQAAVTQLLLPDKSGDGVVPACEILVATSAVRRAIRDNDTHLIYGMMETGSKYGMQTMEQALASWFAQGRVSREQAMLKTVNLQALDGAVEGYESLAQNHPRAMAGRK